LAKVKQMWADGLTVKEIARVTGMSASGVRLQVNPRYAEKAKERELSKRATEKLLAKAKKQEERERAVAELTNDALGKAYEFIRKANYAIDAARAEASGEMRVVLDRAYSKGTASEAAIVTAAQIKRATV
jgi:hypothetical protein